MDKNSVEIIQRTALVERSLDLGPGQICSLEGSTYPGSRPIFTETLSAVVWILSPCIYWPWALLNLALYWDQAFIYQA